MNYSKDLKDACDLWIKKFETMSFGEQIDPNSVYSFAQQSIQKINPVCAKDAHTLLQDYFGNKIVGSNKDWRLGVFISAVYNDRCTDDVIVFDVKLPKPIRNLACNLAPNKIFVNKSFCGDSIGVNAQGALLNYCSVEDNFAFGAKGAVFNYGAAGFQMASTSENLVINCGYSRDKLGHASKGIVFNFGQTEDYFAECSEGIALNAATAGDMAGLCAEGTLFFLKECKSYAYDIALEVWNPKVFLPQKCQEMPEFLQYIENLTQKIETAKLDISAAIKLARELNSNKIKQDLETIINK